MELHMKNHLRLLSLAIGLSLGSAALLGSSSAFAQNSTVTQNNDWRPVASDKLITLPANIIEKRIEQDFSASPMAMRLAELDNQMDTTTARIASLQQDLVQAEGQLLEDLQYELVQQKSGYLDVLQESHQLRKDSLMKKQQIYQDVLTQYRTQYASASSSIKVQLKRQQKEAQARMEAVMAQVDQNLMHTGYNTTSPYANEYASNLAQIDQLKDKINQHKANAAPTIDGAEVSSEEYIRQLLHDASMHQSLLDQEGLMLSYMARLVALDAQALEYQMAYGDSDASKVKPQVAKASQAVGLFL
jgi:primosomal protein N''